MVTKSDVETSPDFAYKWAKEGAKLERQRILDILKNMRHGGKVNEAWFVIERDTKWNT